jgi:hypothetical protein
MVLKSSPARIFGILRTMKKDIDTFDFHGMISV